MSAEFFWKPDHSGKNIFVIVLCDLRDLQFKNEILMRGSPRNRGFEQKVAKSAKGFCFCFDPVSDTNPVLSLKQCRRRMIAKNKSPSDSAPFRHDANKAV